MTLKDGVFSGPPDPVPTAHSTEDRVSIAVALKHKKPSNVTARVSRKYWAGWNIPSALQEKRFGTAREFENGKLLGCICPNNPQKQQ